MNINLTPILQALIGLLAALVSYRLIPWIKAKTTNEQQIYIRALVKAGVYAAEQIYKADGMGRYKMEYVKEFLQDHGYDVDVTEIEAAVSEYINAPVDGVVYAAVPLQEESVNSDAPQENNPPVTEE